MAKLRQQNDRLRDELKELTKQLEQYIEKQRIQK
jgi:cell division protein FtsB